MCSGTGRILPGNLSTEPSRAAARTSESMAPPSTATATRRAAEGSNLARLAARECNPAVMFGCVLPQQRRTRKFGCLAPCRRPPPPPPRPPASELAGSRNSLRSAHITVVWSPARRGKAALGRPSSQALHSACWNACKPFGRSCTALHALPEPQIAPRSTRLPCIGPHARGLRSQAPHTLPAAFTACIQPHELRTRPSALDLLPALEWAACRASSAA